MSKRPLPNIRRLFQPDPGHLLIDCDLSGADAQVVAWEAGDEKLKNAFKAGISVHNMNGEDMLGERYQPEVILGKYKMYDAVKRTVHGTNYAGSARTIANIIGWPIHELQSFQHRWFKLHPSIKDWHRRTEHDLQTTRRVTNKFGYRIVYFDRPDNLLPKGLAWLPQSTIAAVCGRAAVNLHRKIPWATILLQVHDSLVFQVPFHRANVSDFNSIRQAISIEIPYPDPLVIPWGLALSHKSWGDVEKKKWEDVC